MSAAKKEITKEDIWPLDRYEAERKLLRSDLVKRKRNRRCDVGPVCTFYFENYETMWSQVQEMLYIEKGGDEQLVDELAAYNPLIPKGRELVATVMFEIDDPVRRNAFLSKLGGVEETAFMEIGGERIEGQPEEDVDRTTAEGKASSVQFIHFPFTDGQVAAFRQEGAKIMLGFTHQAYSHIAVIPEPVRATLAEDFD